MKEKACRDGFGEGLVIAGEKDEKVVALSADLTESTRAHLFAEKFPERFIQMGVAEQAMITVASGMANYGKIPFTTSYAVFSPSRTWEQIRTTVALNNVPVKIVGAHAGLGAGPYGATHQGLEDISLMRVMPNMVVIAPCDAIETKKATIKIAKNGKPTYIRFAREETPVFTKENATFEIGKANVLHEDKDPQIAIIGCGPLVYEALLTAKKLKQSGIGSIVINSHTIKPLDSQAIIRAAKTAGAVVTVEEHQVNGGLGSAVSEVLAKNFPVPMEFIGIQDSFGESGKPEELRKKFKLTSKDITETVKKVIAKKNE
jgi:transketolase